MLIYAWDILKIWKTNYWDIPDICMSEIRLRYAWDIPDKWVRFKRYLTLICLIFACICLILTWYMPEIFLGYIWDFFLYLHEIWLRCIWDMPKICLRYVCNIPEDRCDIFTWDLRELSDICLRFAKIVSEICLKYAYYMCEMYLRYA